MSHTPHELSEEFPDRIDVIQALKQTDTHFANLCEDYHTVNRAIHRAETDIAPTDDVHMIALRKDRMILKDLINAALNAV